MVGDGCISLCLTGLKTQQFELLQGRNLGGKIIRLASYRKGAWLDDGRVAVEIADSAPPAVDHARVSTSS